MNIVLAFDSFKGSLAAEDAVEAVGRGIRRMLPDAELIAVPVADGGEGICHVLTKALGGEFRRTTVRGPLVEPVDAEWGWVEASRTAIIEMASASGLGLVASSDRNPTRTTTYGVGELILAALDLGAGRIIVGVGGSATVDGGTGMAETLGVRFEGCSSPMTGGRLKDITAVAQSGMDTRIRDVSIQVALDVKNPLLGSRGAAAIFGPQKGATPEQVRELEDGLAHLASFVPEARATTPGAGAAGGLGWGLAAFCGAELTSGIDICLDAIGFDELLEGADLVLTGEGSFDGQSLEGKAPFGVARRAQKRGIPVAVLAGDHSVSVSKCIHNGIIACYSIRKNLGASKEQAISNAALLLETLSLRVLPELLDTLTKKSAVSMSKPAGRTHD